jgi:hypothetical protein
MIRASRACPACGASCTSTRDFLGFRRYCCETCHALTTTPLARGYLVTYTVVGILCAVVLLSKLPQLSAAARTSGYALFLAVGEQWVFILFVVGAVLALGRDARLREAAQSAMK